MSQRAWILLGLVALLSLGGVAWMASGGLMALDAARRSASLGNQALDPADREAGPRSTALMDRDGPVQRVRAQAPSVISQRLRGEATDRPAEPADAVAGFDAATKRYEDLTEAAITDAGLSPEDAAIVRGLAETEVAELVAGQRWALQQGSRRGSDARDAVRRSWNRFVADAPLRLATPDARTALGSAFAKSPNPVEPPAPAR